MLRDYSLFFLKFLYSIWNHRPAFELCHLQPRAVKLRILIFFQADMLPLDSQCCKACLACHSRTKSRPYILLESLRCHVNEKKIIKITKILVLHLFVNVLYSCHLPYLSESYLSLYPSWLGTCGSPPASASQSIGHCAQSPGRNGLLSIFLELCVPFLNKFYDDAF